jgi:phosphoribosylformimino-5-aminoimidazole carboxamide ribotide isomerase
VLIIPAIDLRGGQCVRLRQGDYNRETVFGSDPVAMAKHWVNKGAQWLHIVDLDGAKVGRPVNGDIVHRIVEAVPVPCQLGGGLRSEADIQTALDSGARRVVIGTKALTDAEWLTRVCRLFPDRLLVGIDAIDGRVAVQGWLQVSERSAVEFARECADLPLAGIVYTDIRRDGMLDGPNFEAVAEMSAAVPIPVIASGGITTLDDIRRLAGIKISDCIVGRALYEGRIDLTQAIRAADEKT